MLNKKMMSGRLTSEPAIITDGDSKYCKLGIAVEQQKRRGVDTVGTDNFNCIAVEDNARAMNYLYSKGKQSTFASSLRKDTNDSAVIVVEELHFQNRFTVKADVDTEQLF